MRSLYERGLGNRNGVGTVMGSVGRGRVGIVCWESLLARKDDTLLPLLLGAPGVGRGWC